MLNSRRLDAIDRRLDRIDAALVVRDPGNARSAEVFDGLRRTIAAAMRDRRAHLAQLVRFREAIDAGSSLETLVRLVDDWSAQAGLQSWFETEPAEFFDVTDDGPGDLEVIEPAWVDGAGEAPVLVKPGRARRRALVSSGAPVQEPASHPGDAEADRPEPTRGTPSFDGATPDVDESEGEL